MTLTAILLVLLLAAALVGAALATATVIRGDGRVGPGHAPPAPRSHYPDIFETMLRRTL